MSSLRFIVSSLMYHRRMNGAVALSVAVSTAVLCGALLVGDSVRGSLRHLMLDRLGRIDEVLVSGRMFNLALATGLNAMPDFREAFDTAVPVHPRSFSSRLSASQDVGQGYNWQVKEWRRRPRQFKRARVGQVLPASRPQAPSLAACFPPWPKA